jgi:hypothetical protein
VGKNKENKGIQQGAIHHQPEQHGDKTRERQAEIAHSSSRRSEESPGPTYDRNEIRAHDDRGRDRLFENREQHDEADKNSEKTRIARDLERHKHESNDELVQRDRASTAKRKS